jgi:hypothetical protein
VKKAIRVTSAPQVEDGLGTVVLLDAPPLPGHGIQGLLL